MDQSIPGRVVDLRARAGRTEGLLALLRRRTAAAHADLERALEAQQFFHSLQGYRSFLLRWHWLQLAAERAFVQAHAEAVIADWGERCRAGLIEQDLRWLGHTGATHTETLAGVEGAAEVLGVAYVLEGSTLGGALLLPRLAHLGVTAQAGGRFLDAHGERRGSMWRRFLATLAEWESRGIDRERVADAAGRAFAAAASVLTGARSL
jgi:heme oxygenase